MSKIKEQLKEKTPLVALFVFVAALSVAFTLTLSSCISAPKKEDFPQDACYYAAYFMWLLAKGGNPDASAAAGMVDTCRSRLNELSYLEKMEYCKKNTPQGMTENECRLWLNQK